MNHDKVQNWSGYHRRSTYLATYTLPVAVTLRIFPLLPLVLPLLQLTTLNRYLTRDSNGNSIFNTAWRIYICSNSIATLVTFSLDLVKIHWIQWIQRQVFRGNWNEFSLLAFSPFQALWECTRPQPPPLPPTPPPPKKRPRLVQERVSLCIKHQSDYHLNRSQRIIFLTYWIDLVNWEKALDVRG